MVYITDTFEPCHAFTEKGKAEYEKLLEQAASEIIFRHNHPIRYVIDMIVRLFGGE